MSEQIRIFVADDHTIVREGIISLLKECEICDIVGEASNGTEVLENYPDARPDIILMDISMPELNGFETLQRIRYTDQKVKVVFLTMYDSEEYVYSAYKAGAYGLITKNSLKDDLLAVIRQVFDGELSFGCRYSMETLEALVRKYDMFIFDPVAPEFSLTPREKEILVCISDGMTSHEIAEKFEISKRTIDNHRAHIMAKLDVKTLPELIKVALRFTIAKDNLSRS